MFPYQYNTLPDDEIRLLYLKPGNPGDALKCKLVHVASSKVPKYETISYCWGDTTRSSAVEIQSRSLAIPQGTAETLQHFRHAAEVRVLWVDAICINQDNAEERSLHVAKMHTIYASGEKNLIWIGEDDGTVAEAMKDMGLVDEEMKKETDSFRTFPMPGDADYYRHNRSGLKLVIDLTPLVRLCSRPWFGRLWVVQEAALDASNLCCCGPYTFDLNTFLRVARWLWMKRNFLSLGPGTEAESAFVKAGLMFKCVDEQLGYYQYGRRKGWFQKHGAEKCIWSPTYWLLVGLQEFACRMPIDHVYGMLGLHQQLSGSNELPGLLRPHPDKSVKDAFRDATRLAILEAHSLQTLYAVHRRVGEDQDPIKLPSWLPSWHLSWTPDLDPHPFSRDYQASGDRQLNFEHLAVEPADDIILQGIFIDGIDRAKVDIVGPSDVEFPDVCAYLDRVEELVHSHSLTKTMMNIEKTIAMVLCAGKNAATESANDDDLLGYQELKQQRPTQYAAAARRAYHRRRVFITASGRVGLGPSTMQRGDIAAVLYGGELPFVLRQDGGEHELIGPCYIHGVMEGQAVQEHLERLDDDVWFCIR